MSDENNEVEVPTEETVPEKMSITFVSDSMIAKAKAVEQLAEVNPLTITTTTVNQFSQIASGPGAVVEPIGDWLGSAVLSDGFPTGIVLQEQYNRAWRQATAFIKVLGWHSSQITDQAVNDDGNSEKLWRQFYQALLEMGFFVSIDGPNTYTTVNWYGLVWTAPQDGFAITLGISYPNTSSTCTLNWMGTGAKPILHSNGELPRPGEVAPLVNLIYSTFAGGVWIISSINMNMLQIRLNEIIGALGITLTGDITGSGVSILATTLATVNANVGTFQGLTVNAKGLVTGAVNTPVVLSGDVSGTGPIGAVTTLLASVNVNPGTFQGITADAKGRVTNAINMNYALNSTLIPTIKANSFGTAIAEFKTPIGSAFNWSVPTGITRIQVIVVGGGGGAAGSRPHVATGATAGGGGGGCCISGILTVTEAQNVGLVVGQGGTAATYLSTGGNGGPSSATVGAISYIGTGGAGGSNGSIGTAGTGIGGFFNITAQPGAPFGTGGLDSSGGIGGNAAGPYGGGGGSSGTGSGAPGFYPGGGGGGGGTGGGLGDPDFPGQPGAQGCVYILY